MSLTSVESADNILFILTDQQRFDSIGAYGASGVETPNLDRLAAEGTRYERAYTRIAVCSPSRASIISGVPPQRHGIKRNVEESDRLAERFPCYPQLLRDAGYNVSLAGKLHVGQKPAAFGLDGPHFPGWHQPLDHPTYRSYLSDRNLPQPSVKRFEDVFPDNGSVFQSGAIDDRPTEASFTHFLTELALDQIESHARSDAPFYQSVHYFGPHNPYYLPEKYATLYDPSDVELPESTVKETFENKPWVHRVQYQESGLGDLDLHDWRRIIAAYRGWVTFIDHEIGRLLDHLSELGIRDSTAVVFGADHGGFVTRHKLHDKGPAMYEDIYRIPLITNNLGADGAVDDRFVSLLDLPPTFLDVAGVDVPDEYVGQSLCQSPDDWRDDIVCEFHGHFFEYEQWMLRRGDHKLVLNSHDMAELYDLSVDPEELHNLTGNPQHGEIAQRLYERLMERLERDGVSNPTKPRMKMTRTEDIGLEPFGTRDE
ncbi:sulfatase-like hydrolase/transferase [Haloarcula nitratireducens]|uniref:Sulfatase-like hydrolase/transferase n=1 Tax=Haloarcula nitratireducens TaxID=2487749 RepID=A0AAW4PG46_9EURY|nr:sulfatase-like hydrolase/transferase [Halomicroarcula nitratireducens]MBX0296949.1 sulfatase-like hydrolase/transferase [Halomicroarcula nitratireducens]